MNNEILACCRCLHWHPAQPSITGEKWGICDVLSSDGELLLGGGGLETRGEFGCTRFASRPSGPFCIHRNPDNVPFIQRKFTNTVSTSPPLMSEKAEQWRDWLNIMWSNND